MHFNLLSVLNHISVVMKIFIYTDFIGIVTACDRTHLARVKTIAVHFLLLYLSKSFSPCRLLFLTIIIIIILIVLYSIFSLLYFIFLFVYLFIYILFSVSP